MISVNVVVGEDRQQVGDLYTKLVAEFDSKLLSELMIKHRYNQSKVSKVLGISRTALRTKLLKTTGDRFIGKLGDK